MKTLQQSIIESLLDIDAIINRDDHMCHLLKQFVNDGNGDDYTALFRYFKSLSIKSIKDSTPNEIDEGYCIFMQVESYRMELKFKYNNKFWNVAFKRIGYNNMLSMTCINSLKKSGVDANLIYKMCDHMWSYNDIFIIDKQYSELIYNCINNLKDTFDRQVMIYESYDDNDDNINESITKVDDYYELLK